MTAEKKRGQRKERIGIVVSDKMDKTRVVLVERLTQHPKYKKYVRRRKKFYAHDENNESRTGDLVRIVETRPLSKLKRWRIVEILRRAERLEG
ncbi:MAG: 30S ribosomal protein S17 [Candidatus Hydrothermota bacterium]|nr:MAG: 30S ribosomal protein S17 [Candidatus Hydrothermae bacterium]